MNYKMYYARTFGFESHREMISFLAGYAPGEDWDTAFDIANLLVFHKKNGCMEGFIAECMEVYGMKKEGCENMWNRIKAIAHNFDVSIKVQVSFSEMVNEVYKDLPFELGSMPTIVAMVKQYVIMGGNYSSLDERASVLAAMRNIDRFEGRDGRMNYAIKILSILQRDFTIIWER